MPRPRCCRIISSEPNIAYFKPAGISMKDLETVTMGLDEFEAIKLKDLDGLDQTECAAQMGISQPTFHRIVSEARRKIADVLVNGRALIIEGGNVMLPHNRTRKRCRKGVCRHESSDSE